SGGGVVVPGDPDGASVVVVADGVGPGPPPPSSEHAASSATTATARTARRTDDRRADVEGVVARCTVVVRTVERRVSMRPSSPGPPGAAPVTPFPPARPDVRPAPGAARRRARGGPLLQAGETALEAADRLADAVLVLDEREAHELVAAGAEPDARGHRDVALLD